MFKTQVSLIAAVAVLVAGFAIGGSAIAQTAPTHATPAPSYQPVQPNVPPQIRYPTTIPAVIDDLLGREPETPDLGLVSIPQVEADTAYCCDQYGCTQVDILHLCDADMIKMICTGDIPLCEPVSWPGD